MYCSNCNCALCATQRLTSQTDEKAPKDVVRLVAKSGDRGLTQAQLTGFSRSFRDLSASDQAALLDRLTAAGVLFKQRFRAPVRGRFRDAYLVADLSQ
jgi:hypothetical protein